LDQLFGNKQDNDPNIREDGKSFFAKRDTKPLDDTESVIFDDDYSDKYGKKIEFKTSSIDNTMESTSQKKNKKYKKIVNAKGKSKNTFKQNRPKTEQMKSQLKRDLRKEEIGSLESDLDPNYTDDKVSTSSNFNIF
jgi:hypothetical protein